jgi:hypothetical protein
MRLTTLKNFTYSLSQEIEDSMKEKNTIQELGIMFRHFKMFLRLNITEVLPLSPSQTNFFEMHINLLAH